MKNIVLIIMILYYKRFSYSRRYRLHFSKYSQYRKLEKSWARYLISNVWQELQEKYASQVRDVIH